MRQPLPNYLPSNLTADEIIRALEPCFEPIVLRKLEEAFREQANAEASADNECVVDQKEQEIEEMKEASKSRRDLLEALVVCWEELKRPRSWNDWASWKHAKDRMDMFAHRAREDGLL